jgi:hypothetical protein
MKRIKMKYLKRYEAIKTIQHKDMTDWVSTEPQKVNKPIDPEYFNLVFAEFIDEGATFESSVGDDQDYWEIFIEEPKIGGVLDIDKYLESIDILKEKYLDIKSCINKIKDEYPNIDVFFNTEESGERNAWTNNTKTDIHLIFLYK